MKKIVINKIKEHNDRYLSVDMDVISSISNRKETQYHYEYQIKKEKLDFYYINNSWVSFAIDQTETYVMQIMEKESVVESDKFFTNMMDGMRLSEVILLYGDELQESLLAKGINGKLVLGKEKSVLQEYFKKLFTFYEKIYKKKVNCSIYILNTEFQAVSFPNAVILNKAYFKRPNTYLYKFLPHELFHQVNGCYIKYSGKAKEWMRESFVEYLQLLYLREAISEKFYRNQLEEYQKIEQRWYQTGVSIYEFQMELNMEVYNEVIYGRGVMLFHEIFQGGLEDIIEFVNHLYRSNRVMRINPYLQILEEVVGVDSKQIEGELKRGKEVEEDV